VGAFLSFAAAVNILTALALAELVADKLPKTLGPFATRIVLGAFCGAAVGAAGLSFSFRGYDFAFLLVISTAALSELTSASPAEIHIITR